MKTKGRECDGKIRYEHRRLADDEACRLRRRWLAFRVHSYRCGHCGGWHVGHRMAHNGKRWS